MRWRSPSKPLRLEPKRSRGGPASTLRRRADAPSRCCKQWSLTEGFHPTPASSSSTRGAGLHTAYDMPIAILHPFSGISGDMTLGALVAVGLDPEWIRALPARLQLDGVTA